MAGWRPLKRRDFVRKLRALGFDGPYSGTPHQFIVSGSHRQIIPTNAEYSVPQIRLQVQRGIEGAFRDRDEPENLGCGLSERNETARTAEAFRRVQNLRFLKS